MRGPLSAVLRNLMKSSVAGLHEPLAAEAKRALADLHGIERPGWERKN